ncbi:hypothetical protein JHK85_029189 [Glycine max]|nr:hypothetical protein JHK85_029189 [Glycine max]
MGQGQSKDELLYQQVSYGNAEGIKTLHREGAGLEWRDKDAKTPLIVACMNPRLYNVAKTLIELGANINAFRPANPLVLNDDCLTALEVARTKGHSNVVRTIEDAQPRTVIGLWNANLQDPKLHQSDPSVTVVDRITKTRVKLGPASENDKQQLTWFSNACKGIPQVSPAFLQNNVPTGPPTALPVAEDTELAMAISASLQSAMQERPPFSDTQPSFEASSSSSAVNTGNHGFLGTPNPNTSDSELVQEANPDGNTQHLQSHVNASALDLNPSAPPIANEILADGPIQYPSIDLSPVDMASPDAEKLPKGEKNAGGSGSSCVICLDAPAEGACIPCGHVAGCMSCLNEVKSKKWGCPVCRAKIDQVIKLYHV